MPRPGMKVTKHGTVKFIGREVKEIEGFTVEGGDMSDLREYVLRAYTFTLQPEDVDA